MGGTLSRIDLAESLYPTDQMRDTVVTLNCHIMSFLCRAIDWYKSSSLSRTVQSFTRPAALRYDDLIEDINKAISKVTDLAAAGSQAEQRDMHEELQREHHLQQAFRSTMQTRLDQMQYQLTTLAQQKYSEGEFQAVRQQLQEIVGLVHRLDAKQTSSEQKLLQELVVMKQDIHTTQADIQLQLSQVQLDQALSLMFKKCVIDHQMSYKHAFMRRKAHRMTSGKCAPFWNSQQLQRWDQATLPSSIALMATFRDRLNIRNFYLGVIEQLIQSHIAVFWIIQPKDSDEPKHDIFEVVKSLVAQSLSKVPAQHTDVGFASRVRAFNSATTVAEYMSLLAEILSGYQLAYVIVDVNSIASDMTEDTREILWKVSEMLQERSQKTVLKVMFVGYGQWKVSSNGSRPQEERIRIAQTSKKKGKRVPQAPLRGKSRVLPVR